MAIVFKYKNKSNLSYAPGFATPGEDGNEGKQGTSGNTVYFVDYDLDNSYSIQLALQRIENNQILTSVANKSIATRPYKENDLLISKGGKVYKIVLAPVTSTQNYKYDIQYLGSIRNKAIPSISKVLIACTPQNEGETIQYNASAKLEVFLTVLIEDVDNFEKTYNDLLKNYSFSLTMFLNNKKSILADGTPVNMDNKVDPAEDDLHQVINFYKKLEFTNLIPVPVISTTSYDYDTLSSLFDETVEEFGLENPYDSSLNTNSAILTNSALNRLHPSGNDIRYTAKINGKTSIWYDTGIGSPDGTGSNITLDPLGDAYEFPFVSEGASPTEEDIRFTKPKFADMKYYLNGASNDSSGTDDYDRTFIDTFPRGASGLSLTMNDASIAQEQLDSVTKRFGTDDTYPVIPTSILQMSKKYINDQWCINPNSGSSRYFDYTDNDEIYNFLCNSKNNKYIITVKNKKTHEIYTVEASTVFVKKTDY